MNPHEIIRLHCKALRLPTVGEVAGETIAQAEREAWSLESFLLHLLEQEVDGRRRRRIERLRRESHLPPGKTLAQFDESRLPLRIRRLLPQLCTGDFVDRAENILFFGLPGTGKTHLCAGVGHALIETGRSVLFTPTYQLVGQLLRAKRDYELERELRRLDRFQVVILDDIGYVQQSREEMEVLFTFLAERYERRSVMITSNLVFSEWGQIFKDALTTAAAIDRVVHHSIIIEFGKEIGSLRMEEAARRNQRREPLGLSPESPGGALMPQTGTPWVKRGQLLIPGQALPIALDTPAWFLWLQTATRFCYSGQHTAFRLTVRKEKRRDSAYWYGYLKIDRKLHNTYLGKSERLTQTVLNRALSQLVHQAQKGGKVPNLTP